MKNILTIQSSLYGSSGVSSQLAEILVNQLMIDYPGSHIDHLDLVTQPFSHLGYKEFISWTKNPDQRTKEEIELVALSDSLIAQLKQQDILILAVPMYNLGIPSTLKSWIDRVARAGETFKYTEKGPVGLIRGLKVHLVMTRGGQYKNTPLDTQTDYLTNILSLMGITDIERVYAEGLAMGGDIKQNALSAAYQHIAALPAKAA